MAWRYKIDLKSILNKYDDLRDDDVPPQELLEGLSAELLKVQPLAHLSEEVLTCSTVDVLNDVLSRVYDAADDARVWCGL